MAAVERYMDVLERARNTDTEDETQ
jgi:hypothetical protein